MEEFNSAGSDRSRVRVVSLASYTFLPAKTGGQKNIALFNQYFSRYTDLLCVTTRANDNSRAEGYGTVPLFSGSPLRYVNPLQFFRIRKIIRHFRPLHLLIEHPYLGWLAVLLKKTLRLQLVVHSHNIEALRFKTLGKWWWNILWQYERWTHRNADYNFFITEEDRQYALKHYGLDDRKCLVVTYGIERSAAPTAAETEKAKKAIREMYAIGPGERVLLFAGAFNYGPNLAALRTIETAIVPELRKLNYPFKVIICGPGLETAPANHPQIIYAGFVEDIQLHFQGADVFINPVTEGGGIKTKLVEALSMNTPAVSTSDGAIGVSPSWCNGKLLIVPGNDWCGFARAITDISYEGNLPGDFFEHFNWE